MEISELVSARKFREFNTKQKEELYKTLLQLVVSIEEIPKKSLRRTLEVSLAVLQYKGEQAAALQTRLEEDKESSDDDSRTERLLDENDRLKVMLERLDDEKSELKGKVKQLTEDIFQLQKRIQEIAQTAATEVSDKDSSDPLSELDKQEDLLRNINSKNKHIKRLLREIEALQNQNIAQSKTIIECETELQQNKTKLLQLSADVTLVDSERKALKETVNELNIEIARLEGNITYLEEEREKSERDLKNFIEKLEIKAQSWKNMLDTKDKEVKKLRARLEKVGETASLSENTSCPAVEKNTVNSDDDEETTKLLHALESRDKHIESLESKIKYLAEEMMSSTRLMNQLSAEKAEARNPNKSRACCKTIEESLQAANERCRELSEMLERSEEDNALKSKQALQAISALDAYQRGEDGLVKALRKCTALEQKVTSRDKQIRALIMELNSMHEIAHENGILRRRLNIPDDMVISAKNLVAKERNKDKMIERLTLKLRASEEMRLQLKLEKSDLRKELLTLQKQSTKLAEAEEERATLDSLRIPSEVGEVTDSVNANNGENNAQFKFCTNCKLLLDIPDETNAVVATSQLKYQDVIDENDTLRAGMLEILEKLREYDASSDHITIDTEMLYRLLEALRTSSVPNTPKRLQNELQALKAREEALRTLIKEQPQLQTLPAEETDELSSVESMREGSELRNGFEEELTFNLPHPLDSSTRPTTPNRNIVQRELPIIEGVPTVDNAAIRKLEMEISELKIYRQGFEELQQQMKASDIEESQHLAELSKQLVSVQLELNKEKCSYAFMREEYDNTLNESKRNELRHIEHVATLQKELSTLKDKLTCLEVAHGHLVNAGNYSKEDYLQVVADNTNLRAQLAFIIEQLLAGKLNDELRVPDICADYGIIAESLQLDHLTVEEYQGLQASLNEAQQQREESLRKSTQLESLLEIAQCQIQSQQKLLNEITDNHVNLRHLVADLQSNTEEKLLLAKMQRELDNAKQELSNLHFDFDQLKQRCALLERDVNAKEQKSVELYERFQKECHAKDVKIRFLQKSLYTLREKYAKFTPLIFLTNYIFAYTKFVKMSLRKSERNREDELIEFVKDSVIIKLKAVNGVVDESQNLIKIIKAETQYKILEGSLHELQKRHDSLQEELLEQRINSAKETEHWQTISALFQLSEKDNSTITPTEENIIEKDCLIPTLQNVATNTEAPVPAERKLSTSATPNIIRSKSTAVMLDKNLSPIGSPIRRIEKADATTQTPLVKDTTSSGEVRKEDLEASEKFLSRVSEATNLEPSTNEPIPEEVSTAHDEKTAKPTAAVMSKETTDAIVQTPRQELQCQCVQTETSIIFEPTQPQIETSAKELEQRIMEMKDQMQKRDIDLKECKTALLTANKRIEELQDELHISKSSKQQESEAKATAETATDSKTDIIEKTIFSFHTLLGEKDKSISKYQELLQTEREQVQITTTKLNNDIEELKNTITNLNFNIKTKDLEILELKTKLEVACVRRNSAEKLELATGAVGGGGEDSGDNSLNELTDEKIEEMFQQEPVAVSAVTPKRQEPETTKEGHNEQLEKQDTESLKETTTLLKQIKELKEKASYWEKALAVKDEELTLLKEKASLYEEREKALECSVNPELEQMRTLLEEKEKHINDLTETLNNFHDDQQRFIKDSSSYSADQIAKLHADLTRTEATNKIYHTQVEALRRQITNLTQREKQAREQNQSLRNQLIKRPVVSIKTELNARVKTENLQKRIQTLELDLEDARAQIQRQQIVIEAKRAKSANEVGLWEKQKRWQQNAEKFKAKYEETEGALEKTRALLQSARNMIARLEKEKQTHEIRHGRTNQNAGMQAMKCCRTPSCPNLQPSGCKYTPSESPETYTGASSECSSPAHSALNRHKHMETHFYAATARLVDSATDKSQPHAELIEALKARIELQQRKILALELDGKGSNALTTEMERIQEKLSELEAQNIRLEAKNLQLQLDNDLLRQGDGTERLQKRIKYLEDYIIALKEEMAQAEARRELCKCTGIKVSTQLGQSAEQTILSLRGIVEKLRAENKYLKDGRRTCETRSIHESANADLCRLQKMYSESLDKVAALQDELNKKAKCKICSKHTVHPNDELAFIKEQLSKKTQLLQKAKVLLTRAAAKEKVLKEQLLMWKRKCSELQNVPVIDEISE